MVTNAQIFVSRRPFVSRSRCGCLIKLPKGSFSNDDGVGKKIVT